MTLDSLLDWGLAVIGGGGIGSMLTYFGTYRSRNKIEKEKSEQEEIVTEDKRGVMERDRFEAMYKQITEMVQDYNDLSDQFRAYRKTATAIEDEFMSKARQKSMELAELKDQVAYLKKLRCYDLDCPNRIKDKPKEE